MRRSLPLLVQQRLFQQQRKVVTIAAAAPLPCGLSRLPPLSLHCLPPLRAVNSSPCRRRFGSSSSGSHQRARRYNNDPQTIKDDRAYCVNLVRERDGEAYLCGLLMPAASRDAYFALRAFNVEVASIKDGHNIRNRGTAPPEYQTTSSAPPTFALQMRMQWWRNAIDAIHENEDSDTIQAHKEQQHDEPPSSSSLASSLAISCWNSPVVRSLDRAHATVHWTRRFLERLVDARETDLELRQYDTLADCIQYAEDTVSSLLYLTLETVHVRDDAADAVASLAGIGIGLTTQLRATPYRLRHGGEVPLPAELLRPGFPYHQLLPTFLGGDGDDGDNGRNNPLMVLTESDAQLLRDAFQHVAHTAARHLQEARQLQRQVPRAGRPCVCLPVIPALTYLSKLEALQQQQHTHHFFFANASAVTPSPTDRLKLLLRLGRTWATGVF